MKSYHFSLGNSTDGPVGFCARVVADSPQEAVHKLRKLLPTAQEVGDPYGEREEEYIEVYFNGAAITEADIDEVDDVEVKR